MTSALFDLPRIAAIEFLAAVEHHAEIASTNDRAVAACRDAALETPLLVLADMQTVGRGRGANRWWSTPGAITFSLVIEPAAFGLIAAQWPVASLVAALAVCETLESLAPLSRCGLKWPNDVYLDGRKIAGVLVEAPRRVAGQGDRLVLGVGVNINNRHDAAPREVRALATSLVDAVGKVHDLTEVLTALLERLQAGLRGLADADLALAARWRVRSLLDQCTVTIETVTIETATIDQDRRRVVGRCLGIAADGALELETDEGPRRFHSGVVAHVEPDFRHVS